MDEAIRLEKLTFSYPDGQQALAEVSLVIDKGESVGIVGPNGAGKSTLLLHLNGILRSDNGAVKVLGQPVDDKNLRWIRSKVGVVFQDPDDQLFSPTVFDDVAFGPINMDYTASEVRQAVTRALDWAGKWSLIGLLKKLPVTKIVATHDIEMLRALCQRIIVLNHGRLITEGTTESVLSDKQLLVAHGLLPGEET